MQQIYLLSVVTLLIGGLTLARAFASERISFLAGWPALVDNDQTRRIIGIVAGLVGIIKLFVVVKSPDMELAFVVGDFLPAAAGIVVGILLLYEDYYARKMAGLDEEEAPPKTLLLGYRDQIGMTTVVIGLVHFLMPSMPML